MYVLDDRFSTVVAFVDGFNAAHDGQALAGFGELVADRVLGGPTGLHWAYVIANSLVPDMTGMRLEEIPPQFNAPLTNRLLDLIDEFVLASRATGQPMNHLLVGVEAWVARHRGAMVERGLAVEIERSPGDRSKQAVSVGIDAGGRVGQLVVWDSGEVEMTLGGVDSDEVAVEAGDVETVAQVEQWLHRVWNGVTAGS
ncbi:hypothetical protein [Actinocrispum sp. NPDC049592]|uniref:immunity protein TriTu family protein n=1 Tax=Actinocrispum sp. NPDC049592 TaxID=3154835 RepID=UPI003440AEEF